uniref:uncharacterized protein LOC110596959 n=1 Tax=Ictidomys tridecemlineatus TaxID=43179 RepID=UPI000B544409|nr:uncharacterized protein LOC110596959 [Ictidomys tridecemlineatus]
MRGPPRSLKPQFRENSPRRAWLSPQSLAQQRLGAWPRDAQTHQEDQGRGARALLQPRPRRTAGKAGAVAPGLAAADSGSSRPRLRPWPLPLALVGSSTPLSGSERTETRLVRRRPAAAINLRAGPASCCLCAGIRGRPRIPRQAKRLALLVTAWRPRLNVGNQARISPFAREGTASLPLSATTIHHHEFRTPRWPEVHRSSLGWGPPPRPDTSSYEEGQGTGLSTGARHQPSNPVARRRPTTTEEALGAFGGDNRGEKSVHPRLGAPPKSHGASDMTPEKRWQRGGAVGNLALSLPSPKELRLLPRISRSTFGGTEGFRPDAEEFEPRPGGSLGAERLQSHIPPEPPLLGPRKRRGKQSAAVSAQG